MFCVFFHLYKAAYCWKLWKFHYLNENVFVRKISLVHFAVSTNFSDCTAAGLVSQGDTTGRKWTLSMGLSCHLFKWKSPDLIHNTFLNIIKMSRCRLDVLQNLKVSLICKIQNENHHSQRKKHLPFISQFLSKVVALTDYLLRKFAYII